MSYQFLEKDKESFAGLGSAMSITGLAYLALGAAELVFAGMSAHSSGLKSMIAPLAIACFFLAIGAMTRNAGRAFTRIAVEKDGDIAYLMKAVEELHRFYGIQKTLILLLFAASVLGLILVYFR